MDCSAGDCRINEASGVGMCISVGGGGGKTPSSIETELVSVESGRYSIPGI